jgi:hypothetical protein
MNLQSREANFTNPGISFESPDFTFPWYPPMNYPVRVTNHFKDALG